MLEKMWNKRRRSLFLKRPRSSDASDFGEVVEQIVSESFRHIFLTLSRIQRKGFSFDLNLFDTIDTYFFLSYTVRQNWDKRLCSQQREK